MERVLGKNLHELVVFRLAECSYYSAIFGGSRLRFVLFDYNEENNLDTPIT